MHYRTMDKEIKSFRGALVLFLVIVGNFSSALAADMIARTGRWGKKSRSPVELPYIGYSRPDMQYEPQKEKGFRLLTLVSLNISINHTKFLSYHGVERI